MDSSTASASQTARPPRPWVSFLLAGLILGLVAAMSASPAVAQIGRADRGSRLDAQEQAEPSVRLPSWAEPNGQRPTARAPTQPEFSSPGMQTNDIGPEPNPNRVPLGGLEWLIAAGIGYGVLRLRKGSE